MTKLPFEIYDVFTSTRFAGNALALVKNAEILSDEEMQTIAREFNLSETIFILPTDNIAHSAKVRIFTPGKELPFAGHPTVGAAVMLASERIDVDKGEDDAIIVLEEKIGAVRVGVRVRPGKAPFAEFDIPKMPNELPDTPTIDELSMVLGLPNAEFGFENHQPSCFEAGVPFTFVPIRNLSAMANIAPDRRMAAKLLGPERSSLYLYCRETVKSGCSFHARMFPTGMGIGEDPATGSAAAAFAGVVMKYDQPAGGTKNYIIEQGLEMDRASEIHLEIVVDDGLHAVRIGGHVVKVASGTLEV